MWESIDHIHQHWEMIILISLLDQDCIFSYDLWQLRVLDMY